MENFKPLLASPANLLALRYPIAITPKLDGIRCIIKDGHAVSRTLKPIRNRMIKSALEGLPSILDGELIALTNNFQDTTSLVMSATRTDPWEYHIFDYIKNPREGYSDRIRQLEEIKERHQFPDECRFVFPEYVYTFDHLEEIAQRHVSEGFEGSMLRAPEGIYKFGRSTTNEQILVKLKQFSDTEAVIVGFEELLHNDNEATVNVLGLTERSTHKENKRASGMLGAFIVHPIGEPDKTYKVGTGLTQVQRIEYWQHQAMLLGRLVKVKYFAYGIKDLPRSPVFLGFRHQDDL